MSRCLLEDLLELRNGQMLPLRQRNLSLHRHGSITRPVRRPRRVRRVAREDQVARKALSVGLSLSLSNLSSPSYSIL
jgi:hypothetical protein